ncbi:MAG: hypothetical protein L0F95_06230, partial [Lactococcus sp.]
ESSNINLFDYIYKSVQRLNLNIKEEYFKDTLKNGKYLILLDGFDELKGELPNVLGKEIKFFADMYNGNSYIVSSRPSDAYVGWNDFVEFSAKKLTKLQSISLIRKIGYDKEISDQFIDQLDKSLYDKYYSFASIPLLLSIMLLVFENGTAIPEKVNDFYELAYSTLYQRHDFLKSGFKRAMKTNLSSAEFKEHLCYISFKTFFASQFVISDLDLEEYVVASKHNSKVFKDFSPDAYIDDLTNAVCLIVKEGINFKFSHRSFQEYFSAVYVSRMSDEVQKVFLQQWIKENSKSWSFSNIFFDCLKNIQIDRYMLNVVIPIIEEYEKKISTMLFEDIVNDMFIGISGNHQDENICLNFSKKYDNIFHVQFEIFSYASVTTEQIDEEDGFQYQKSLNSQLLKLNDENTNSLEELEEVGIYPLFMDWLKCWWLPRTEYILDWKKKFLEKNSSNDENLAAMLSKF